MLAADHAADVDGPQDTIEDNGNIEIEVGAVGAIRQKNGYTMGGRCYHGPIHPQMCRCDDRFSTSAQISAAEKSCPWLMYRPMSSFMQKY